MPLYESKKKRLGGKLALPLKDGISDGALAYGFHIINCRQFDDDWTLANQIDISLTETNSYNTYIFPINKFKKMWIIRGALNYTSPSFQNFVFVCKDGSIKKTPIDASTLIGSRIAIPGDADLLLFDVYNDSGTTFSITISLY